MLSAFYLWVFSRSFVPPNHYCCRVSGWNRHLTMCCTVKAVYCLSVAGLIGTSNHVVAMLFRIEHAVIFNLTKPTSTSKLCTWNVPSGSKVDVAPKRIKDICFGKAQYMKKQNSKNKTTASKRKFLAFSPNWSETANK